MRVTGFSDVLVLHDQDPIGRAVCARLREAGTPVRELAGDTAAEAVYDEAFGCRGVIAVGDRAASQPALVRAAQRPGVRALVLVASGEVDLRPVRRSGVPYAVLRPAPLLEALSAALEPVLASGRLVLDPEDDVPLSYIAAEDLARCAVAALHAEEACGRTMAAVAPERPRLSELAKRLAAARGLRLKVSAWPRWLRRVARALGRAPFRLPPSLVREAGEGADLSALHGGPWRTPESVAASEVVGEAKAG